jgi:hypothetical protein
MRVSVAKFAKVEGSFANVDSDQLAGSKESGDP